MKKPHKKPNIIIITGSVGAGKTTLAQKYKKQGYTPLDVNQLIKKHKLYDAYDHKNKCFVVDEKKLATWLEQRIQQAKKNKQKLVIDSHLSHYLSPKYVDLCIVVTCDLKTLYKRLKKRGYSKKKIEDNLQCEIMEVCYTEALEKGHKVKKVR